MRADPREPTGQVAAGARKDGGRLRQVPPHPPTRLPAQLGSR